MAITTKLGTINPEDLPTPPDVAMRIIQACSDPDISAHQLAEIVGSDPALLTELLSMVNSPFFGTPREITTAARAVVVLGNRALRNYALCFSAREVMRHSPVSRLDSKGCWEDMLRRAVSARLLAEHLKMDVDEAFTLGLLQDIGLMAMFIAFPDQVHHWQEMRVLDPEQRHAQEQKCFGVTHEQFSHIFAKSWILPEHIATPLSRHHTEILTDLAPNLQVLSCIARVADWMASIFTATDQRLTLAHCRKLAHESLSIEQAALDGLLGCVPESVERAAQALGLKISRQTSFQDIVQHANRRLISENRDDKETIARLEQALADRERLAEELQKAYECLAQLAYFDPLTTLINRRRFDEAFRNEMLRHGRSGKPLSLMILDLDGFRQINDSHGHAFGDQVLQGVASVLRNTLRTTDMMARLGGEEMCILLPETDAKGGLAAADRLRKAIEHLQFTHPYDQVHVTATLGGATWQGKVAPSMLPAVMKTILDSADRALHQAKHQGRNRVQWDSGDQKVHAA